MAHGLNPMIKLEIECNNVNIKPVSSNNSQTSPNKLPNCSINKINQTVGGNSGTSAKMGSRRIFTPQFKLQVLDSYRNDSDCKGNQRATARKYGIHRRQIQKWLQCENNLRSSVANLNQNNMKHQFHNISHHHQIPVVSSSSSTIITTTHTINNNSSSNNTNQQYKTNVLSLDTARHSVGLTPRPMAAQAPVPVAPTVTTSAIATPSTVMAAIAPSRLITTTTKCSNSSNISGATAPVISTTSLSSSSLKSPTHTITKIQAPPYNINMPVVPDTLLTHTPAIQNISSVPLIQHYPHHHSQQHYIHNEQQYQHQQQLHHYQYHTPQQHESCLLMPSASLPMPSSNSQVITPTNRSDELRDYQPIAMTENCCVKEDYKNHETYENFNYYTNESGFIAPIDLSLGSRRTVYEDEVQVNKIHSMNENRPNVIENTQTNVWPEIETNNNDCKNSCIKYEIQDSLHTDSQAIDLSFRKRKNYDSNDATPEKIPKISKTEVKEPTAVENTRKSEVETDNRQQEKPVKLFKPYLLDDNDESVNKNKIKSETHDPIIWSYHPNCTSPTVYDSQSNRSNSFQQTEYGYPFQSSRSPTFQRDMEQHSNIATTTTTAPSSPNFITRTSPPTAAGATSLWCPKGSPVSGYDSASTYSDSSDYIYRSHYHTQQYTPQCQTYSLDLKMQAIDNYYYDMTCRSDQLTAIDKYGMQRNDVQRWLDQDSDIRQGIAIYV